MIPTSESAGLVAQFNDADELVAAATRVRKAGYRQVEAYAPLPVEGLPEALGFERTRLPLVVLCGGIIGGLAGLGLQYYATMIAYPMNIGGRPLNSWPSFVPVTFETTVLGAALAAVLGMLAMNGLPRPHHPLFNVPEFKRASQDQFFLYILRSDPSFHQQTTREFLEGLGPVEVSDVPL